jgi:hypothetical protein
MPQVLLNICQATMNSRFHWGLEGLDYQKFRAYTTLLQLRCGSQEDPAWASKFSSSDNEAKEFDNQDDDDADTVTAQQIQTLMKPN